MGLVQPSAYDTLRAIDEAGGGAGGGYTSETEPDPIFPVNPNPVYYDPVPVLPVEPVEPILPIYPVDVEPAEVVNQIDVVPGTGSSLPVLPLLTLAALVLTMTGLSPLGKKLAPFVFAGGLGLLYYRARKVDQQGTGVQQSTTL